MASKSSNGSLSCQLMSTPGLPPPAVAFGLGERMGPSHYESSPPSQSGKRVAIFSKGNPFPSKQEATSTLRGPVLLHNARSGFFRSPAHVLWRPFSLASFRRRLRQNHLRSIAQHVRDLLRKNLPTQASAQWPKEVPTSGGTLWKGSRQGLSDWQPSI